ncbi:MAG: cytochrome c oxidase assembly protein [Acidimicrobiales bacterium]
MAHPDPAMALLLLLAALLYGAGVRRLARRGAQGRRWPRSRTVAFGAGLVTVGVATQSGLARYDTVLFSLHTVQHLLLGMLAPLLFALGAPVTLALQASGRTTQRSLLRVVHHPVVATATHPVVAWVLFGGTLFALYFSPLFELSLRNRLVHQGLHLHFLGVGALFFWTAVGVDPTRHRISHPARLLFVLLAVPFHAFLGLAVLSSDARPLGGDFYACVTRTWGSSVVADQHTGAGVLWAVGDLFGLLAGAVVVTQWIKADERRQTREDRRLDAGPVP